MKNKLAVFILSHGRPNNVVTYNLLRRSGYTGQIYILVDNEDKTQDEYIKNFGDEVIIFDKSEAARITDAGDNTGKRGTVLFARNWNFVVAKELGITYFWQLDDDYRMFSWTTDGQLNYITSNTSIKKMDDVLQAMCNFLDESNAHCVAFAQGGDFMGGSEGNVAKKIQQGKFLRKAMNSFLCRTDRPFKFYGRMNDDVNMYTVNGNKGMLFITVPRLRLNQAPTQTNEGALTDTYRESGTYVKSFYTILYKPSCAIIGLMGQKHQRFHHKIKWKNTVPQIISEDWKKQ